MSKKLDTKLIKGTVAVNKLAAIVHLEKPQDDNKKKYTHVVFCN
jgi:hypothetical protein